MITLISAEARSRVFSRLSFGMRDLGWVRRHIQNQRERHARGEIEPRLERITTEEAEAEPREGP